MTATMTDSITITRTALLAALGRVSLAASRGTKGSLPILSTVRIAPDVKGLRFTTTDLDCTISTVFPCEEPDFAPVAVPCLRLQNVANQLPSAPVTFSLKEKGVRVAAGRARFDIVGMNADEFPLGETALDGKVVATVNAGPFVAALARVRTHAQRADESSMHLNGVHVADSPEGLTVTATDRMRMARELVPGSRAKGLNIIIPESTVIVLTKLFTEADEVAIRRGEGSRIAFSGVVSGEPIEVISRTIEGPYPDCAPFFKREMPTHATVDRLALLTAVKRVASLSTEEKYMICLEWRTDAVRVLGVNDEGAGDAEDVVPCSFDGGDTSIYFNSRYLIDGLVVRQAEAIIVGLHGSEHQMALRDEGAPGTQSLIMPRRAPRR